jgi:hypothetical protein
MEYVTDALKDHVIIDSSINVHISFSKLLIEPLPRLSPADRISKDAIVKSDAKQVLKLLDDTNIKIISQILDNPTIGSLALSKKLDIPLSTIQRRRARIEKAIVKKNYTFDYKAFGGRVGDLIVNVDKGKSKEIAQSLLKKYKNNIVSCDTGINSTQRSSSCYIQRY